MSDVVATPSAPAPSAAPVAAPAPAQAAEVSSAPRLDQGQKATAATPASVETAPDAKPVVEVDGQVSKHYAELAKRRAAQAESDKKIAERAADVEAKHKAVADFEALKGNAKQNVFGILQSLGITHDDIAEALLTQGEAPKVDPTTEKLTALEQELKAIREREAAAEKIARAKIDNDNIAAVKAQLGDVIKAFPTADAHPDGREIAFSVMTQHYAKTKQVLPFAEACSRVEQYLTAGKPQAPAEQPKISEESPKAQAKKPLHTKPFTLSNKSSSDTPPAEAKGHDPAANRERAIKLLKDRQRARQEAFAAGAKG